MKQSSASSSINPELVDVRLALGTPQGNQALRMTCPAHIHRARIGQEDSKQSLAVYQSTCHCFGCGYHIARRFAALAFVLNYWDGLTGEHAGVLRAKERLAEFTSNRPAPSNPVREPYVPEIDPYMVEGFHQYLLTYAEDRLVDELMIKRGLSLATIQQYRLGHTGTHFSIPVLDAAGRLYTVRYRTDDTYADGNADANKKYEGTWGRNDPRLFPLQALRGLSHVEELWIVEGEFDAISGNQAGDVTLTVTNGSGQVPRMFELICAALPRLVVERYVIATDQDGAGEDAALKLFDVLCECGQQAVRARWEQAKDLTELYSRGGSRHDIRYE